MDVMEPLEEKMGITVISNQKVVWKSLITDEMFKEYFFDNEDIPPWSIK